MKAARAKAQQSQWFAAPPRRLKALDAADAAEALAELVQLAAEEKLPRLAKLAAGSGPDAAFLGSVLDLSEFVRDAVRRQPQMLERLFEQTVEERLAAINAAIRALPYEEGATEASIMKGLRLLKGESHFLVALAELAGEADVAATVRRLSALATLDVFGETIGHYVWTTPAITRRATIAHTENTIESFLRSMSSSVNRQLIC